MEQEDVGHGSQTDAAVGGKGGDDEAVSDHTQREDKAEDAGLEGFDGELVLASLAPVGVQVVVAELRGAADVQEGEV